MMVDGKVVTQNSHFKKSNFSLEMQAPNNSSTSENVAVRKKCLLKVHFLNNYLF